MKENTTSIGRRGAITRIAVGLPALLGGCAMPARDPRLAPPKPGECVVALSVTSPAWATGRIAGCVLQREDVPETHAIGRARVDEAPTRFELTAQDTGDPANETCLLLGVLSRGRWRIVEFTNSIGDPVFTVGYPYRALATFELPGEGWVDLGRFVVTDAGQWEERAIIRSELVRSNRPRFTEILPDASRFMQTPPSLVLAMGRNEEMEESMREKPTSILHLAEHPDGFVMGACRMGTVVLRSPDGHWSTMKADLLETLRYVAACDRPDAQMLAVGDLRTIVRWPRGGDRLHRVDPGNLPNGLLLSIGGSDAWGWYVVLQGQRRIRLLRSDRLEQGDWKELDTMWSGEGLTTPAYPWFGPTAGHRGLCWVTRNGIVRSRDYASGEFFEGKAPGGGLITSVTFSAGGIGIYTPPPQVRMDLQPSTRVDAVRFVSRDAGRHWIEIPTDLGSTTQAPHLVSESRVVALTGDKTLSMQQSDDLGKTWKPIGRVNAAAYVLLLPQAGFFAFGGARNFWIQHFAQKRDKWEFEYPETAADRAVR